MAILVLDGSGYSFGEYQRRGADLLGGPVRFSEMEEAESSYSVSRGIIEVVDKRWALWDASIPYYRFPSLGHMFSMASQYIFGHGGYLSAGLASHLRTAFPGATIVERYSLAEIFGGATRTQASGSFVSDPHVLGEVLDEQDRAVDHGAVGELTLTELYPFVQMQPLIRYRTGDLVQLEGRRDDDRIRFQWWGRRVRCQRGSAGERPWVLGQRALLDWLSLQPLVAHHQHRPQISSVTSKDLGTACVDVLGSVEEGITIVVGVRANPWALGADLDRLASSLWNELGRIIDVRYASTSITVGFRHVAAPTSDYAPDAPVLWLMPAPASEACPPCHRALAD